MLAMAYIKTIFIIGILILIFPLFGLPSMLENFLLIVAGIILIISSLLLRRQIPHTRKADPESTSFTESDIKVVINDDTYEDDKKKEDDEKLEEKGHTPITE